MRRVESNKGDDINPNVRSRLAAREIHSVGEHVIFAPTPPLESLRMALSFAATDLNGSADPSPAIGGWECARQES